MNGFFLYKTHDSRIVEVTSEHKGTNIDELTDDLHGIDGMYTFDSHILFLLCVCGLRTCIFYSEPHGYIGLAHAGWEEHMVK